MYACRLYSDRGAFTAAGAYAVPFRTVGKDGIDLHHCYLHRCHISRGTACRKADGREEISMGARDGLPVFSDSDGSFSYREQRHGRRGRQSGYGIHAVRRQRYVRRHDKLEKKAFHAGKYMVYYSKLRIGT